MKLTASAVIEKVATRVDNTLAISISTQELDPTEAATLFTLKGKQGYFLFAENQLSEVDIPKEPAVEFKSDKSPSQRLRSVLYIYWKDNTNKAKTFDEFYKSWIEKKIQEIKDNLN